MLMIQNISIISYNLYLINFKIVFIKIIKIKYDNQVKNYINI